MEATSVNLHITNFVRPFTLLQARQLIEETCKPEFFWMDSIKSQCYVVTSSLEQAIATFEALNDKIWPFEIGKPLKVAYVPKSELPIQGEF